MRIHDYHLLILQGRAGTGVIYIVSLECALGILIARRNLKSRLELLFFSSRNRVFIFNRYTHT